MIHAVDVLPLHSFPSDVEVDTAPRGDVSRRRDELCLDTSLLTVPLASCTPKRLCLTGEFSVGSDASNIPLSKQ